MARMTQEAKSHTPITARRSHWRKIIGPSRLR